jgi:mono/diheme cytochrome c family protein
VRAAAAGATGPSTPAVDGARTYADACVFCHDTNTGPTLRGRQLHPAYVRYVVRNGMAAMPAFRPSEVDDATLAALADYVASLPAAAR